MRTEAQLAAHRGRDLEPHALRIHRNDAPLSGRAVFDADSCQYADAVRPGDLDAANFDTKDVRTGGDLYLVEALKEGRVVWRGCRRLTRVADGIAVDQDGRGDWVTVRNLDEVGWRVAGRIERVYRPTNKG
ncbi:MAG: hypothetical protein ACREXY_03720 [Gammaproteobacteria bacterium]